MVLADNGSSWFTSGASNPGWDDDDLQHLRTVAGSAFEAVDVSSLPVSPTSSYAVRPLVPTSTATTVSSTTTAALPASTTTTAPTSTTTSTLAGRPPPETP